MFNILFYFFLYSDVKLVNVNRSKSHHEEGQVHTSLETTFNHGTLPDRQIHTTTHSTDQVDTVIPPPYYDEVFNTSNNNHYTEVTNAIPQAVNPTYAEVSPTRRVTQVEVRGGNNNNNSNDYQLPFGHHQYATLEDPRSHSTSPSSDMEYNSPASPYLEPVPSCEDITNPRLSERRNVHGITLPPIATSQLTSSNKGEGVHHGNKPAWYSEGDDDIVTPTVIAPP